MSKITDELKKFFDTPDSTAEFDSEDREKNGPMALLSYLSWLVLIPIFLGRSSKFVRYHINQGLLLAITETVVIAVLSTLSGIPYIGWLFSIIDTLAGIVFFVVAIFGIVNAYNGNAKEIPYIGRIRIIK